MQSPTHLAPGISLCAPTRSGPQPSYPPLPGLPFLPCGIQLGFCAQPLSPLVFSLPMTPKTESSPALTEHWTQAPCVSWTAVSPWVSHRHQLGFPSCICISLISSSFCILHDWSPLPKWDPSRHPSPHSHSVTKFHCICLPRRALSSLFSTPLNSYPSLFLIR